MLWHQGRCTMSLSAILRGHLTTAYMGQSLQRGFTHMNKLQPGLFKHRKSKVCNIGA